MDANIFTPFIPSFLSLVGHYHFRHHSKEMVSVRIGLWFSSYFGATTSDFSTFRNALIVAKISPIDLQGLPSVMSPPTSSSTSSSATFQPLSASLSTFPSVLLPAPGHSSSEAFAIPRRSRTPSLASADGGAKFSLSSPIQPLPPLQSFGGSSSSSINLPPLPPLSNPSTTLPPFGALGTLPPLGALPPLGTFPSYASPPRKRPPSTAIPTSSGTPFHHLNTFDHGSGLNSSYNGQHLTSKPRLRSPTPHSGHRRSMSSEAGHSNYSTASSSTSSSFDHSGNIGPFAPLDAFPPIQRPQSRNRRTSQLNDMTSAFDTNGSSIIPHIPKLLPDSPSKLDFFRNSTGGSFHHNNNQYNPYHNIHHSPYKPRKQSYIAIDDSFNSPPSSSPSASGNSHHDKFRSTSLDFGHFPFVSFQEEQEDNWLPLSSLPSSFAALSLDSPNSGNSPTESQY